MRDSTPASWTRPGDANPGRPGVGARGHHFRVPDSDAPDTTPATDESEVTDSVASGTPALPRRLVFRMPGTAYVAVLFFVLCASSVALVSTWFALIYLIPLGLAFWIMRTRTEVDAERIVVRRVLSRTTVPWAAVKSLRLSDKGWVRAVRTDGRGEIALPTVRTRHLPALALISGGRISDPTARREPAES